MAKTPRQGKFAKTLSLSGIEVLAKGRNIGCSCSSLSHLFYARLNGCGKQPLRARSHRGTWSKTFSNMINGTIIQTIVQTINQTINQTISKIF
ncbi:MAG: hypothetical protein NWR26_09010 [Pseudomonadales bacterium]|nr:hypothetical protein [Pseudomonadales bacterium]